MSNEDLDSEPYFSKTVLSSEITPKIYKDIDHINKKQRPIVNDTIVETYKLKLDRRLVQRQ